MTHDDEPMFQEESGDVAAGTIWDRRREIGLWPALWGTVKQVIVKPADFFSGVDPAAPIGPGLIFFVLVNAAVLVLSVPFRMATGTMSLAVVPVMLVIAVVGLFLLTAVFHIFVRMFGGTGGINGTLQVMMYSAGAGVFGFIPVIGQLASLVLTIRASISGYMQIHDLPTKRAAWAYGLPMMIFVLIPLIAAVAIPTVLQIRISTNEALAQSALRTLSVAAEAYKTAKGEYPSASQDLVVSEPPYLLEDHCGRDIQGYRYDCSFSVDGYRISAKPVEPGPNGRRVFTMSTGGEFREVGPTQTGAGDRDIQPSD